MMFDTIRALTGALASFLPSATIAAASSARTLGISTIAPRKATSCGSISAGGYATSSDALLAKVVAVTEAPIDALSITIATLVPAMALCGVAMRDWLRFRALSRTFLIATDNDAAGDRADVELVALLEPLGARCRRVHFGTRKDANEMLLADGRNALITAFGIQ